MKIATDPNNYFYDAREIPPPLGTKILLLTVTGVCVIGTWNDGFIGWKELPKIPESLKYERTR